MEFSRGNDVCRMSEEEYLERRARWRKMCLKCGTRENCAIGSAFAACVDKWRMCVRRNLGYDAAFFWRRLLAIKGYRVESPWYYKVGDAGLIAFRCRR